MSKIVDQTSDPGMSYLEVILNRYPGCYEYVKQASVDPVDFLNLKETQFAWPSKRQFPINDKSQVVLSYGYSKIAQDCLPHDVVATLDTAMKMHNADPMMIFPEQEKVAADDFYYLLPDFKRFKVVLASDVNVMEDALHSKAAQLNPMQRLEAASRLVKIASQFKVELNAATYKMAGETITDVPCAIDWILGRQSAAIKLNSKVASVYSQLADSLSGMPNWMSNKADQVKLANALFELDKQAGIDVLYGHMLPDPFKTIFNTNKRTDAHVKVGSCLYDANKLSAIPLETWKDILGPEIQSEIAPTGTIDTQALTSVLNTLPTDLKKIVDTQLSPYLK
jgi:hypothetical protein